MVFRNATTENSTIKYVMADHKWADDNPTSVASGEEGEIRVNKAYSFQELKHDILSLQAFAEDDIGLVRGSFEIIYSMTKVTVIFIYSKGQAVPTLTYTFSGSNPLKYTVQPISGPEANGKEAFVEFRIS